MDAWDEWIGREERRTDVVTDSLLARFHATIGGTQGDIALPGLHWCLCPPDAPMDELGEDGHPAKGGFLPPIPLPRRMWAASELQFRAPIRSGAQIERISKIVSVSEKTARSGRLAFVEVDHITVSDGIEAVRERQTLVYRGPAADPMPLPAAGAVDLSNWPVVQTLAPDPVLLFRYSALTFNSHRIHYDLPYSRDIEDYPALVVHGPLIASFLLDLAAHEIGAPAAFSFRALSPAFADQPLHLAARPEANGLALRAFGNDGRIVMEAGARIGV